MKKVYGVFAGSKWAIVRNKANALKLAKKYSAEVRTMSLGGFNDCPSWDAPTFRVMSEPLQVEA